VSELAFLSPDEATVVARSPVPSLGELEVRGDVASLEGAVPLGPGRALVITNGDARPERDRLRAAGFRVYDMTAALAAVEIDDERLMRRLTELDLDRLPATGSIARGTPAVIQRLDDGRFRLFVPHELAHFVAEVVEDIAAGLE
jgi:hypothetical protein